MRMEYVDYRAELRDLELARIALTQTEAMHIGHTVFTDTVFRVSEGTLTRRVATNEPNEWILRSRLERASIEVTQTEELTDDQARARFGTRRLPVWVAYTMRRDLWMIDTTRVCLDEVENLGSFLLAQALIYRTMNIETCTDAIERVRTLLAPALGGAVATDYAIMIDRDGKAA